jgi:hypothetical protein
MEHTGDIDGDDSSTNQVLPQGEESRRVIGRQVSSATRKEKLPEYPLSTAQTFYSDGVFFVKSDPATATDADLFRNRDAAEMNRNQSEYRNLLHHRFLLLRSTLRCSPPASAINALDDSHPISFPSQVKRARADWRHFLLNVNPQMVQLACMDYASVLAVLNLLGHLLGETVKSENIVRIRRVGAWVWGLLGRCREIGQMSSEEVGEIRHLGKRTTKILEKLRSIERNQTRHEATFRHDSDEADGDNDEDHHEAGDDSGNDNVQDMDGNVEMTEPAENGPTSDSLPIELGNPPDAEALSAAKLRLQALIHNAESLENEHNGDESADLKHDNGSEEVQSESMRAETRAMLDMIITIVGEFYGQRDLLDCRDVW